MPAGPIVRRRLVVAGIVQGVGFRPFTSVLAARHGLAGVVRNTPNGVEVEVEGPAPAVDAFEAALTAAPPPLARITGVVRADQPPRGDAAFVIVASDRRPGGRTWMPPDVGLCAACRAELLDPANRRFRHPFISCTDCGPRFTIVEGLPYDRAATTMRAFEMCAACAREYGAPGDRRLHAEPIACHDCGPRLWLEVAGAVDARDGEALRSAIVRLARGEILAVKGVGGCHLVCDAANPEAVARLRDRKGRPFKPFALLLPDLDAAGRVARLSDAAREALQSPVRPIVLVERHPESDLAPGVAPHLADVGVMLPHAPLHELIARDWSAHIWARSPHTSAALVMTSGNRSEEPVVVDNEEARRRLGDLADALLLHDRTIRARCDDAVVADRGEGPPLPIRRSRGDAPVPLPLPVASPAPLLAVGGELKAAFCLGVGADAVMSPHVGDMEHAETLDAFTAAVDHLCRVFDIDPEVWVCDDHPGYLSARWAQEAGAGRVMRVQHHHAHAASLMAEHGLPPGAPLLVCCFDGTGYGPDGTIWGGEVLLADYTGFQRVAHLAAAPLPGGDAGVRRTARLALAYLHAAGIAWDETLPPVAACTAAERRLTAQQLASGAGVVTTSSMGRLFDVVSAIAGVCQRASYEGQAAAELEAAAGAFAPDSRYCFEVRAGNAGEPLQIGWHPVVRGVAEDARSGLSAARIGAAFHGAVAHVIAELADRCLPPGAPRAVGATGGVFQNRRLTGLVGAALAARGVRLLTHRVVPPNDGGLALGQAAVAAARLAARQEA